MICCRACLIWKQAIKYKNQFAAITYNLLCNAFNWSIVHFCHYKQHLYLIACFSRSNKMPCVVYYCTFANSLQFSISPFLSFLFYSICNSWISGFMNGAYFLLVISLWICSGAVKFAIPSKSMYMDWCCQKETYILYAHVHI